MKYWKKRTTILEFLILQGNSQNRNMVYFRMKYSLPSCLTLAINQIASRIVHLIYMYIYIHIFIEFSFFSCNCLFHFFMSKVYHQQYIEALKIKWKQKHKKCIAIIAGQLLLNMWKITILDVHSAKLIAL